MPEAATSHHLTLRELLPSLAEKKRGWRSWARRQHMTRGAAISRAKAIADRLAPTRFFGRISITWDLATIGLARAARKARKLSVSASPACDGRRSRDGDQALT
jgi:hypothetical protein